MHIAVQKGKKLLTRPVQVLLGLLGAILVFQWLAAWQRGPYELPRVYVDRPEELQTVFSSHDYQWPPQSAIPALGVTSLPDGMNRLPVSDKKSLFFRTLMPLVLAENARLREQREFIERSFSKYGELDAEARKELQAIARKYRIDGDLDSGENRSELLSRVDTAPPALVLAQAANESGWGSSRFAVQANNLFGVWTYDRSQGLKPLQRETEAQHYVRVYPSLQQAVRDYLFNLNVGHAYEGLRQQRATMRARNQPLDALTLAGSLERYSERGSEYVSEIRGMIRSNDLDHLERLELDEGA